MEDDTFKRILQDKQSIYIDQSRAEGNNTECVGKKRFNCRVLPMGFGKSMCYVPPFWTRYQIIFFFLMVICNSLLLLKSLPINVINCIKFYVNCSVLTGTGLMIGNTNILFVCLLSIFPENSRHHYQRLFIVCQLMFLQMTQNN